MKIVVFDLDETLGYFTEFGIFWDSLGKYIKSKYKHILSQSDFDAILDLFPEFLRPNIINILTYLKGKKQSTCCHKMMIYTNNTGPKIWANHIISYFENKINYNLIDQIIAAFKINGKQIEISRTTHNKTYNDFIQCTKIPESAEICFLDDTFYPYMANDKVYYINIKPYYYDLQFDYMIQKFKESDIGEKLLQNNYDNNEFDSKMMEQIAHYRHKCIDKDLKEYEIDKIIGKQIIKHLHEFFRIKRNKSIRKNVNIKNKTQKNIKTKF